MEIKNQQVSKIYDGWKEVWEYEKGELDTRLKAYSIMKVIKALVAIYEGDEKLDEEEIEDLFIDWSNNEVRPVLPEELKWILVNKKMEGENNE
ncbi:hypothetical protein [Bacillus smithii]|uniref:hypothetical protein n=1 Tax=Bacillus smithii TaxID=1479 RepID=UPI003D2354A8